MGLGFKGDRTRGEFWDSDVAVGGHVGTSSLHVCHRTVQRRPCLVR